MDGVIVINKPTGQTSHNLVGFTRRLLNIKKVGHTGTLDPDASGVLPVCIGRGTKAADMLTASDKAYRAQFILGMTTDTLDASGEILTEQPVNVTKEQIEDVIKGFIGEIFQIPPMFSAIKKDGKKLYELAREGITIEREKRKVTIFDIKICELDMQNYAITIEVFCSKGTYIRTLCEDIGMKLGCGAYMNTLVRIKSANFTLEESYTPEELLKMKENGTIEKVIIPVDKLFLDYDKVVLDEFLTGKAKNVIAIRKKGLEDGNLYRIYGYDGEFLCISEYRDGALYLKKAFWN
ncbi:MAG: tRNA pseudouridine(55) synthase TruB [Clostridia bacterium]|nr:tRNA pseudouridine(55) synthase TruB [Clostridia bacterium]